MGLYEKIESDMKDALKKGDAARLSVLRMLISAVKTMQIDKNLKTVEDENVSQIIQKQIKQHKESVTQFEKGNRQDLAGKEKEELKILEAYVPKQMDGDELLSIVKGVISETGMTAKSDMGKVMKAVMEKVKGRANGKSVNEVVMKLLK